MRYVVGFMFVLALAALPQSASAQAEESAEAPKQAVEQEPAPSSGLSLHPQSPRYSSS